MCVCVGLVDNSYKNTPKAYVVKVVVYFTTAVFFWLCWWICCPAHTYRCCVALNLPEITCSVTCDEGFFSPLCFLLMKCWLFAYSSTHFFDLYQTKPLQWMCTEGFEVLWKYLTCRKVFKAANLSSNGCRLNALKAVMIVDGLITGRKHSSHVYVLGLPPYADDTQLYVNECVLQIHV